MKISVVIPTLNEEFWLRYLLESITIHGFADEIIVSDNHSTDRTVEIAESYGCKVVEGGIPSKARNSGAEAAQGDLILFVDADVILTRPSVEYALKHIRMADISLVHFPIKPISPMMRARLSYSVLNNYFKLLSLMGIYQGLGIFMCVKKADFLEVGGFDDRMSVGEDLEFFQKISKRGRILYEKNAFIYSSSRRFAKENLLFFGAKGLIWSGLRALGVAHDPFVYKWANYSQTFAVYESRYADELVRGLSKA